MNRKVARARKTTRQKQASAKQARTRQGRTREGLEKVAPARAPRLRAYRPSWRAIAIDWRILVKLLGSARCSGLVVEHQQQTQWCWAAVSNSVSHYYDPASTWSQCTIANAELGQTTCCTNGSTAACNQWWYLDRALNRVGRLLSWGAHVETFASIKSLINAGHPPCARQGWSGGGGHFMGITCYYEGLLGLLAGGGSKAQRLKITDPWYGDSIVDYTVFASGYQGTGTWTHSYRTQ